MCGTAGAVRLVSASAYPGAERRRRGAQSGRSVFQRRLSRLPRLGRSLAGEKACRPSGLHGGAAGCADLPNRGDLGPKRTAREPEAAPSQAVRGYLPRQLEALPGQPFRRDDDPRAVRKGGRLRRKPSGVRGLRPVAENCDRHADLPDPGSFGCEEGRARGPAIPLHLGAGSISRQGDQKAPRRRSQGREEKMGD